ATMADIQTGNVAVERVPHIPALTTAHFCRDRNHFVPNALLGGAAIASSSEPRRSARPTPHLGRQAFEMLLVRDRNDRKDLLVMLGGIECLSPFHHRVRTLRLEFDRQNEMVIVRHVLDLEHAVVNDAREPILVRIVLSVRTVQGEEPPAAGTKLEYP